MSDLIVTNDQNILLVDSRIIAQELGIEHPNFLETVRKYQRQSEQAFGILRFETGVIKGRGQPEKYCLLTEEQSTFYLTLSRNTSEVVNLKVRLVKAFSAAKQTLLTKVELPKLEKPRLKLVTKKLTVKQFVSTCKLFLDLVPDLDANRKATLVFSAAKQSYPECAEIASMAQSSLPPIAVTEQSYTPTEIGSMLNFVVSGQRVNTLLESAGLQTSYLTARQQKKWKPTEIGKLHSVLTIEAKHNGAPVESIRWKTTVIELLTIRTVSAL